MNYTTTWTLDFADRISAPVRNVQEQLDTTSEKVSKLGDRIKSIRAIDWYAATEGVNRLLGSFGEAAQVGENFETALLDVSAIAGVTGEKLDALGDKARGLSKKFGTEATDNLETFKTILSRLGPQLGESEEAMDKMGAYVNTLAKTMGGDAKGATDALTTSMLQFKVDLDDPIEAAAQMERMMNAMAAGAKEGASEVPQISAALVQAGGAAKLSNVSFEETNSALQMLAKTGKYGAEAGVGLRNVLIKMNAPSALSKQATEMLKSYGVNMKKVSDASVPFAERLKELQKIGQNTDALAAVFGAENIQAAQGLINTADAQAELTEKITGTNVAYEQAETVMSGWSEKIKRAKAWIEDLKIGSFGVTKVLGVVGSAMGGAISVVGDLGAAYSGLAPVLQATTKWLKSTVVFQKLAAVWTKIVTALQWLWNAALSANPIALIIIAIAALVAAIIWLVSKVSGWGEAWKHIWEGAKLLFEAFVLSIKAQWNTMINALMIGLNKIKEGWYKFKNAVGLGNKNENNQMLAQIQADTEQRKKAIADGVKKAYETGIAAKKEFELVPKSLKWKEDKEEEKNITLSNDSIVGNGSANTTNTNTSTKNKPNVDKNKGLGGRSMGGGGSKTINFKVEMKNYFSIDRSIGSKEVAANGVVSKINDRLRDAVVTV